MTSQIDNIIANILLSDRMRPVRHIILQLLLFLVTISVFWDTPTNFVFVKERVWAWLGFYLTMNFIVYVNLYVLVPRFLMVGRLIAYIISGIGLIFILLASIGIMQATLMENYSYEENLRAYPLWLNLTSSVISLGLFIAGTSAIQLFRKWLSDTIRVGELESATLKTELGLLKNQINPHFLFNMLNNSYILIKKSSSNASDVIFKLEDMLRYQINDSTKDEVELSSDIRFLEDFLNLEKIRRDNFDFKIQVSNETSSIQIPPLLFIPFVENAVKHNNDVDKPSFVDLSFEIIAKKLKFVCLNSKPFVSSTKREIGGIGLTNIKRRLELLYPNRHTLNIVDTENTYIVELILEL